MNASNQPQSDEVILEANHRLPLLISGSGLAFIAFPIIPSWISFLIIGFGLFLLLQSFTLKVKFTEKDFVVIQLGKELRRFPFKNWIAWRLLLPKLPGFFYFREEASPHLLPILFKPDSLAEELRKRVGKLEKPSSE